MENFTFLPNKSMKRSHSNNSSQLNQEGSKGFEVYQVLASKGASLSLQVLS